MAKRLFTRAQVLARFNEMFSENSLEKWTATSISLLDNITPPTWVIAYKSEFYLSDGTSMLIGSGKVLFSQQIADRNVVLRYVAEVDLPENCATVDEEDAEIKRIYDERVAKARERLQAKKSEGQ